MELSVEASGLSGSNSNTLIGLVPGALLVPPLLLASTIVHRCDFHLGILVISVALLLGWGLQVQIYVGIGVVELRCIIIRSHIRLRLHLRISRLRLINQSIRGLHLLVHTIQAGLLPRLVLIGLSRGHQLLRLDIHHRLRRMRYLDVLGIAEECRLGALRLLLLLGLLVRICCQELRLFGCRVLEVRLLGIVLVA